jgi:hypothetical protein
VRSGMAGVSVFLAGSFRRAHPGSSAARSRYGGMSAAVKIFGCRPRDDGATCTGGRRPKTCKGGNRGDRL